MVLSETQRILLFLFGCVPVRTAIIAAIWYQWVPAFFISAYLYAVGVGFLYLYVTHSRMSAPEGGGHTWWAQYRLAISLLYITAGVAGRRYRTAALAMDLGLGIMLFLREHKSYFV